MFWSGFWLGVAVTVAVLLAPSLLLLLHYLNNAPVREDW